MIREEAMVLEWSSDPHPNDTREALDQAAITHEIQKLRNFIAGQFALQSEILQKLTRQVDRGRPRQEREFSEDIFLPNGRRPSYLGSSVSPSPQFPQLPLSALQGLVVPSDGKEKKDRAKSPDTKSDEVAVEKLFSSSSPSREHTAEVPAEVPAEPVFSDDTKMLTNGEDPEAVYYAKKNAEERRKKFAVTTAATGELKMDNIHTAEDDPGPTMHEINWSSCREVSQYLTRTSVFIYGIMAVIMFNLVSLGIEVDIAAQVGQNEIPLWFDYMNMFVVSIFVAELTINIIASGWGFCCGGDKWWNFFDVIIVILSVVETVVSFMANALPASQVSPAHLRFMRPIRLARALRGVRVMRLFRYVGALRTLLLSIMSSIASLFWTIVLLLLLFYSFGVLLTQLVSDHCRYANIESTGDPNAPPACAETDDPALIMFSRFWSSVPEAMLTLFMAISGGIDWGDALAPLRPVGFIAVVALILYIIITVFTVVNVVTGVFCNTAIESAAADKDIAVMKQMRKHAAQVQVLKHVFKEIDHDSGGTGAISMENLKGAMQAHKLSSFFESMGISTSDVWTLFKVIDEDGSGTIDLDEFVSGCMRLHGPASSLDIAKMGFENDVTRDAVQQLASSMTQMQEILHHVVTERASGAGAGPGPRKPPQNAYSFAV